MVLLCKLMIFQKSTGILLLRDFKMEIKLHYQLYFADFFFFLYLNKSNVFVQKDNTAELHVHM